MAFDWHSATDAEVDYEYSPSLHALRPLAEYLDEYHRLSQSHDVHALRKSGQPLLIYIHGGYWQRLSATDSLFNAPDALRHGVSLHAVEYTLAPHAQIPQIIEECIADVVSVIEELQPSHVVLAGCSAGAHLAAMCARDERIATVIRGCALLSGVYDVRHEKGGFRVRGRASSGGYASIRFALRGDGNAYADGSWNGGGADYAEYFEWYDANPEAEDRRGISVVLDGNKIREAQSGEDPIGIISGNPSVVGDAAWNKWNGKYLRDEYGTYIQEDYEVEDEDGNTVIQQRRKLNPAYDPDTEYIPREQRPEWDCVGLMGKLRIRKGQVTGSRWIKMRDISDSVEEWLVR